MAIPAPVTMGKSLINDFMAAGLVPENCISFTLHVKLDCLVMLDYTVYADGDKLKGVKLAEKLTGHKPPHKETCGNCNNYTNIACKLCGCAVFVDPHTGRCNQWVARNTTTGPTGT